MSGTDTATTLESPASMGESRGTGGSGRRVNADRILTRSLDSTEEGLAMKATHDLTNPFDPDGTAERLRAPRPAPVSDFERAMDLVDALGIGATSSILHVTTMFWAPWSKSRPRFARNGHTYSKPEDVDAETRTANHLRQSITSPFTGNVALGCIFFRPNRQRIDTDNLIKHVCDSANGVLWADDSQCTAVMGVLELDESNPRTIVVVGEHYSTLTRGSDATYPCEVCGKSISIVGQSHARKLRRGCSAACRQALRGFPDLGELVPCPQCGTEFRRSSSYSKFCSRTCAGASFREKRRNRAAPNSLCETCGKQLAHRRGGRCRECWCADPAGRSGEKFEGGLW